MSTQTSWKRRYAAYVLCAGAGYYAVQRVSNSDRGKQLAAATLGYTSAALAASELISKLTMDANLFINAEADAPIPDSIRQVVRLVNTPELEECAQRVSSGVARGMAGAASAVMGGSGDGGESNSSGPSAAERLLDKLLDPRNWGVVSVVVGTTTRQTLELLIEVWRESNRNAQAEAAGSETIDEDGNVQQTPQTAPSGLEHFLEKALHLAASEDGKSVLLHVCSTFVENAVGTYLEKTAGSNTFDDFFAAALAASNREAFGDIAGRVTGEAVRTVVNTLSPAAAGAVSRRAQQRRHLEEEEAIGERSTTPGGTSRNRSLFHDSPRTTLATNSPDDSPPSTGSDDTTHGLGRNVQHLLRSDNESAAVATAAFTSALLQTTAPRVFSAFTSPDGRRLVADVFGVCAASATRSFVLSIRDAVFFVDSPRKNSDGKASWVCELVRFAVAVLLISWIALSLLHSLASICETLFGSRAFLNAPGAEFNDVAETLGKTGRWLRG